MPDDIRMKRIEAFFQRELSRIVIMELRDPVFEGKVISFPSIKVSKDLSTAHVNVSVLASEKSTPGIVKALNHAERLIRSMIMDVSDLRRVPRFTFHEDYTIEAADNIEALLNRIEIPPPEPEEPESETETEIE